MSSSFVNRVGVKTPKLPVCLHFFGMVSLYVVVLRFMFYFVAGMTLSWGTDSAEYTQTHGMGGGTALVKPRVDSRVYLPLSGQAGFCSLVWLFGVAAGAHEHRSQERLVL